MKKIHSQPGPSTSRPPTTGPTRIATPAVAPHRAMAWPREAAGKVRVMTAIVCGVSIAAPRPCTTRASDEAGDRAGQPAPQRREREDRQADEVEVLRAVAVAEPPGDEQRRGIGEQVGAGHPDDAVDVGVQPPQDRGRRDRHDRRVDEDHEEADDHRPEGRPRVVARRHPTEGRGGRGPRSAPRALPARSRPVVRSSPAMVLPSRCLAQHPRLSTRRPTAVIGLSAIRGLRDRSGVRPACREPQRVGAGERDHPPRQVGVRAAQARLDAEAVR